MCAQQKLLLRSVRDTSTFVFCCWIAIQKLLLANVHLLGISVWPHVHLRILISVTSSFFTWELVTDTVSIPYSIAGWTIILCIFPLTHSCGGTLLSHRMPDIFLQLFHPHCVLLFIPVTHVTIALQSTSQLSEFGDLWQLGTLHLNTS